MPRSGYCLLNIPTTLPSNEPRRTAAHAWALLTKGLTNRQREVLDHFRYLPDSTNRELVVNTGWTVNRVTARIGDLRKLSLVLDVGKRPCKITGGGSHRWKAKHILLPQAKEENPKSVQAGAVFN